MFVQKKYPEVKYTLHIELTQEETERIANEVLILDRLAYPTLYRLLATLNQEANRPPRC